MPDTLFDTSPEPKTDTPNIDLQLKCVGRELGYRRAVYGKRVKSGSMRPEEMDYEIGVMSAVYASLKRLKAIDEKRAAKEAYERELLDQIQKESADVSP